MSIIRYDCFENHQDFEKLDETNRKRCFSQMNYEVWELPQITNPIKDARVSTRR